MQKFIKDSANNYVLYVDRGLDFEFSVPIATFDLDVGDFDISEFSATIKENGRSFLKSYNMIVQKGDSSIIITIPNEISIELIKTKYSFDVIYTLGVKKYKAISGVIYTKDNVAV